MEVEIPNALPPPPRELHPTWTLPVRRLNRSLIYIGVLMALMLGVACWLLIARPTPPLRALNGSDLLIVALAWLIVPVGVFGAVWIMVRRMTWLFRHGEESIAQVAWDRSIGFKSARMRYLTLWVHGNEVSLRFQAGEEDFDEFEIQGSRFIRVVLDPRNPRRCHPVPAPMK